MSTKTRIAAAALAAITLAAFSADAMADKKWTVMSTSWCTSHGYKNPCEVFTLTAKETESTGKKATEAAKSNPTGNEAKLPVSEPGSEPKLGAVREGVAPR